MVSTANRDSLAQVLPALVRLGLAGRDERPRFTRLTGGVSSDIWRVDLGRGATICVKRAAPRLRVAADWRVPVERNAFEAAWLRQAEHAVPGMAPRLLGQDAESGLLAMEYLAPEDHPVWKTQLLAGVVEQSTATGVAGRLAGIHAATAHRPEVARLFRTDEIFWNIRLEPYLVATAVVHPSIGGALRRLAGATAARRTALVHGDVSPKNILVGSTGPVFLDAECAWFGDPAFDLAFCLNHLLLKCIPVPAATSALLDSFSAMADVYLRSVSWESNTELERRAASLLPALSLARIDGKSPVEYITELAEKDLVRGFAVPLIHAPCDRLSSIRKHWRGALNRAGH